MVTDDLGKDKANALRQKLWKVKSQMNNQLICYNCKYIV